eukprot:TRINITY_DN11470_c0_g2_i1.p1 TRINITY_DN11470_c0_g2~~TRINITY_DN11470_c0_g2_i1.p1  ORF type:complete len:864 (+),score=267.40 TRINITY_DN11470_c0_g2_i1:46-2637(+)
MALRHGGPRCNQRLPSAVLPEAARAAKCVFELPKCMVNIPARAVYSGRAPPPLGTGSPPPPATAPHRRCITRTLRSAMLARSASGEFGAPQPSKHSAVKQGHRAEGTRRCGTCTRRKRLQRRLRLSAESVSPPPVASLASGSRCSTPRSPVSSAVSGSFRVSPRGRQRPRTAHTRPTVPAQPMLSGATTKLNGDRQRVMRIAMGCDEGNPQQEPPPAEAAAGTPETPRLLVSRRSLVAADVLEVSRIAEQLAGRISDLQRGGLPRRQAPEILSRRGSVAVAALALKSVPTVESVTGSIRVPPRPRSAFGGRDTGSPLHAGSSCASMRKVPRPQSAPYASVRARPDATAMSMRVKPPSSPPCSAVELRLPQEAGSVQRHVSMRRRKSSVSASTKAVRQRADDLASAVRRAQAEIVCAADYLDKFERKGPVEVPDHASPRLQRESRARDALRRVEQQGRAEEQARSDLGCMIDYRLRLAEERKRRHEEEAVRAPRQRQWLVICPAAVVAAEFVEVASRLEAHRKNQLMRSVAIAQMKKYLVPLIRRYKRRRQRAAAVLSRFALMWRLRRAILERREHVLMIVQLIRSIGKLGRVRKQISFFIVNVRRAQQAARNFLGRRQAQRDLLLLQFNAMEEKMIHGVKNVSEDVMWLRREIRTTATQKGIQAAEGPVLDASQIMHAVTQMLVPAPARQPARTKEKDGTRKGGRPTDDDSAPSSPAPALGSAASKRDRALDLLARTGADRLPEPSLRELGEKLELIHKRPFTPYEAKVKVITEAAEQRSKDHRRDIDKWVQRGRQIQKERLKVDAQRLLKGEEEQQWDPIERDNPRPHFPLVLQQEAMLKVVVRGRLSHGLYVPKDYVHLAQ